MLRAPSASKSRKLIYAGNEPRRSGAIGITGRAELRAQQAFLGVFIRATSGGMFKSAKRTPTAVLNASARRIGEVGVNPACAKDRQREIKADGQRHGPGRGSEADASKSWVQPVGPSLSDARDQRKDAPYLRCFEAWLRVANQTDFTWPGHFPHVTRPFGLT